MFTIYLLFAQIRKFYYWANVKLFGRNPGKIILDTNIYYKVGSGSRYNFFLSLKPIVAIYNNFDEMTVSYNLLSEKIILVRSSLKVAHCLTNYKIMENAFDYLIKLDNPDFVSNYYLENYDSIENHVSKILSGEWGVDFFQSHRDVIENRAKELQQIADLFMDRMNTSTKAYVQNLLGEKSLTKDDFWRENHIEFAKYVFKHWIQIGTPTNHIISSSFDWSKLELFIAVLEQFLRDLIMTGKKMQGNDWYDMFNMIYVHPGDKYQTEEKFWLRMICQAGMNHYLAK